MNFIDFCDHMAITCLFGAVLGLVFLVPAGILELIDRFIYPIKDAWINFISNGEELEDFEDEDE